MPASVEEAVQDPQFRAAPVPQQVAYLSAIDPDFKNGKAEDQLAYLNHITGKQAPTTANNPAENKELPQDTSRATIWQKAKAIPAALAPDENTHPLDAAGRMASGAWSGLKAMNPFQGATEERGPSVTDIPTLGPALGMATGAARGYQEARGEGAGVLPSVGAGLAGLFGLDAPGIRQRAAQGDVAGVIGEGIPAVAATVLGAEAHRLPNVKTGIANLARTPEGELHPILEKAARVGGAAAGHILGPVGSIAGYEAGPNILNKFIPDRIPTVEKPFVPQGPKLPAELAGPGGIPVVGSEPLKLANPNVEPEAAIQQKFGFPSVEGSAPAAAAPGGMPAVEPGRVGPPMQRLGELIEQGAGTRPLEPAVPLREQLPNSVGSAAAGFTPATDTMQNAGGKVTFRREPIIKTVPGLEEGPLRATAPEKIPAALGNEFERAAGGTPEAADVEKQRLQTKYPDRETRQLVHANGEAMIDAIGSDREMMKQIHDLKNPDVRQAAINAGENMVREDGSPIMVNNRMLSGDVTRQAMFKRLLDKGYTPKQIVELAHQEMEEGGGGASGKPGPMRATRPGAREKTGD